MIVLGIDPGSEATGWGVIEGSPKRYRVSEYGVVRANARLPFAARLLKVHEGVVSLIEKFRPDVCAVEESFFAVNPKTALKLGHVRGVILLAAESAGVEIAEYAPRLIKQTVVGYGAAEKRQVQAMVRALLSLKEDPAPYDASDALAAAICHMHHAGLPSARGKTPPARAKLEALLASASKRRR